MCLSKSQSSHLVKQQPNYITFVLTLSKTHSSALFQIYMHFGNITQSPSESRQDQIVWLKSAAIDHEFSCPGCQRDLSPLHVKDQFIRGLFSNTLQTDILAKVSHLQTLEQLIAHAEAFETTLQDQLTLSDTTDPSSISHIRLL